MVFLQKIHFIVVILQYAGFRRFDCYIHHRGHVVCTVEFRAVPSVREIHQSQTSTVRQWHIQGGLLDGKLYLGYGEFETEFYDYQFVGLLSCISWPLFLKLP